MVKMESELGANKAKPWSFMGIVKTCITPDFTASLQVNNQNLWGVKS